MTHELHLMARPLSAVVVLRLSQLNRLPHYSGSRGWPSIFHREWPVCGAFRSLARWEWLCIACVHTFEEKERSAYTSSVSWYLEGGRH